jgi:hypothetical protein
MSRPARADFQDKSSPVLTFGAMQCESLTQTKGGPNSYQSHTDPSCGLPHQSHQPTVSLGALCGTCSFLRTVLASSVKSPHTTITSNPDLLLEHQSLLIRGYFYCSRQVEFFPTKHSPSASTLFSTLCATAGLRAVYTVEVQVPK